MVTNINIKDTEHTFEYRVELEERDDNLYSTEGIRYEVSEEYNRIDIQDDKYRYIKRKENSWEVIEGINNTGREYVPESVRWSRVKLYLPEYSVDTYNTGVDYALTINTWIGNKIIYLGSFIFNRADVLASDKKIGKGGGRYYEYIYFDIINPHDLLFSSNWKRFRETYCYKTSNMNSNSSLVSISLYPVIRQSRDEYTINNNFTGGSNSLNITSDGDYLSLSTSFNLSDIGFDCKVIYNNKFQSLYDYIKYTYDIDIEDYYYELLFQTKDEVVIGPFRYDTRREEIHLSKDDIVVKEHPKNSIDDNNILYLGDSSYVEQPILHLIGENHNVTIPVCEIGDVYPVHYDWFSKWGCWREGVYAVISLNIMGKEGESLYILSNKIPITPEIYKTLLFTPLPMVELNKIDMNIYNINTVNKIVNEVITVEKTDDIKSNIISPIFYRVGELANIIIHPEVTEYICINLDAYKSKVKVFKLQVENTVFIESGRNNTGVIFKIIGSNLPKQTLLGNYYILNDDSEVVIGGKYIYE